MKQTIILTLMCLGVVLLIGLPLFLSWFAAARAKRAMQCIGVEPPTSVAEVRGVLEDAGIHYSDLLWSPSQRSYIQPGAAQRDPGEIWIHKGDTERVKQILEFRYRIEITEFAIVVHEKLDRSRL